ncbi:MAG: hypothetical protein AB1806_15385 [Acidobacteriota bacterium]
MPWTCRWSQLRPANPAPLWLDEWMAQWGCLLESRPEVARLLDRCIDCERWESRDERADQPHAARSL